MKSPFHKTMKACFLFSILATVFAIEASAQMTIEGVGVASVSWTEPNSRIDDSALLPDEIAGYSLFFGEESAVGRCDPAPANATDTSCYPTSAEVAGGIFETSVNVTISGATTLYFAMATRDTAGNMSAYSDETPIQLALDIQVPPRPPGDIEVEISITCTLTGGITAGECQFTTI